MESRKYWYAAQIIRTVDGDSVIADVDLGCNVHIEEKCRLYGIDAPEIHNVRKNSKEYKAGMKAKEFLTNLIEGREVIVKTHKDKKGKFGRYLIEIFLPGDDISINQLMIIKGFATEYFGGKKK